MFNSVIQNFVSTDEEHSSNMNSFAGYNNKKTVVSYVHLIIDFDYKQMNCVARYLLFP